jgi:hypothetical protein
MLACPVVVNAVRVPDWPPPDQVISHLTVACTGYSPADGVVYVCPQVGDGWLGSAPGVHAVPGPLQVTVRPSPIDHATLAGFAVAVTVNPPADADADRVPHEPESTHSHVGTKTTCGAGGAGFTRMISAGSRSRRTA